MTSVEPFAVVLKCIIHQDLLWLGGTELERLDIVNRNALHRMYTHLREITLSNAVNKIPTALPSFRSKRTARYDWLSHYGTCSWLPYITNMSSIFTCRQLLYNAFLHAIVKKTERKMTNFFAVIRFILFSSVWFTFFLTLENMLLHNWGTGHEKRDFARDEKLYPRVSGSLLPGGALAPRRPYPFDPPPTQTFRKS